MSHVHENHPNEVSALIGCQHKVADMNVDPAQPIDISALEREMACCLTESYAGAFSFDLDNLADHELADRLLRLQAMASLFVRNELNRIGIDLEEQRKTGS